MDDGEGRSNSVGTGLPLKYIKQSLRNTANVLRLISKYDYHGMIISKEKTYITGAMPMMLEVMIHALTSESEEGGSLNCMFFRKSACVPCLAVHGDISGTGCCCFANS